MDKAAVSLEADDALRALLRVTPPFDRLPEAILHKLCGRMTRVRLAAGQVLYEKDDRGDAMYVVVAGAAQVTADTQGAARSAAEEIGPGKLIGEIQFLVGGRRTATVRARVESEFACLAKSEMEAIALEAPQLVATLGELIRKSLRNEQLQHVLKDMLGELDDPTLRRLEGDLEWVELRGGETLFRQGDPSDCMYIVISGRLIGVRDTGRGQEVGVEFGRGDTIGEMGFFTDAPRSLAIRARRTSYLVRFAKPVFERLSREHPQVMLYVMRLLIGRLQRTSGYVRETYEHANIVVLPISPRANAAQFTERLVGSLRAHGETLYINSARLDAFLGVPGFAQTPADSPLALALDAGLDDRESGFRYAVYECDHTDTPWTRRCVDRADRILLLADPGADAELSPMERDLLAEEPGPVAAHRTLVLLHPETTASPTGTRHWLAPRSLEGHHHLRRDRDADFERLARFLTGNAVGAVLGGGGARGLAHIGVIRAMREAGVPIDLIGGTSMGALIAAQPALGWDDATMLSANRKFFVESAPVTFREYTFPVYALINSHRIERSLLESYGDVRIEDLWTGFFCVSSDLTRARAKVHRDGPVWKAVRASIALPGVFAPVVYGKRLLVDGAVLNNLPGDVMRQLGGGWVMAVDVSPERDLEVRDERLPSPWRVLLRWCLPFVKPLPHPNIVDLMMRTTLLGSIQKSEAVKKTVDLYIQPPLGRFRMNQFKALEQIAEAGYRHATVAVSDWLRARPEVARFVRSAARPD
jgi:NTE family protein/lysophospholipid hydrolase